MPPLLIISVYVLIISGLLAFITYFTIDRPIARWAFLHLKNDPFINFFCVIPEVIITLVPIIYIICSIRYWFGRYTHTDHVLFALANSVTITYFLNQFFKPALIRHWPNIWQPPTLLHVYTSHTAHFLPSEYIAVTIAATAVLFVAYRLYRLLIAFFFLIIATALVANCYCYLSEAIAGAALGFIVASCVIDIVNIEHLKTEIYTLG